MTQKRICDKCLKDIEKGEDYIKLQKIVHNGRKLEYIGIGDICMKCFNSKKGWNGI